MDQNLHTAENYDFRQYDRIWQRVAPGLEPYPASPASGAQAAPPDGSEEVALRQESQLPGAVPDPCCMGSAASDMLNVLIGFAEEELEERRQLLALMRQSPSWARQTLRDMAAELSAHARRLMAVHYLITGSRYRPLLSGGRICPEPWLTALRDRYHAAACSGFNYARAAEGTTDPCLAKLLEELSRESYARADSLLGLLERSLR